MDLTRGTRHNHLKNVCKFSLVRLVTVEADITRSSNAFLKIHEFDDDKFNYNLDFLSKSLKFFHDFVASFLFSKNKLFDTPNRIIILLLR